MFWDQDWIWGLPLIVLTTVLHVIVLGFVVVRIINHLTRIAGSLLHFCLIIGSISFLATLLLAFEAGLWAMTYVGIGALPNADDAMLYSLSAITAYGQTPITLEPRWQLMGALEALNGIMLFGLTTAFFFDAIRSMGTRPRHE